MKASKQIGLVVSGGINTWGSNLGMKHGPFLPGEEDKAGSVVEAAPHVTLRQPPLIEVADESG